MLTRRLRMTTQPRGTTTSDVIYRVACGQVTALNGTEPPVWSADSGYSGTTNTVSVNHSIDRTGLVKPAPQAVYQYERWATGPLTYTFGGLTANTAYRFRLHFAEVYYSSAGGRVMNATLNGITVLSGFDIFAVAGGQNKATIRDITGTANASGQAVITLTATSASNDPKICGIEISGNVTRDDTPTNLTVQPATTYVSLAWQAPALPTGTITGYNVYQNGVKITSSPITNTSFSPGRDSSALSATTNYTFIVKPVINGAESTKNASINTTTTAVSTGTAWPLRLSANKRYFEDQNAKPFLVIAETSWTMLTKLSVADCKWIIDTRKAQGFNTIMTNLEAFVPGSSGPRGGAFAGGDLTQWNESYLLGVDEVIRYAAEKDMHIMLNAFWMADYVLEGRMPSTSVASALADKVGRRYRSFTNVTYFVGGDRYFADVSAVAQAYASALRAVVPDRLITYHSGGGGVNIYPTTSQVPSLDFRAAQLSGKTTNINADIASYYNASPTLPAFLMEPPYDPTGWESAFDSGAVDTTPFMHRENLWGAFLGTAMGVAYGGPSRVWYSGYGGFAANAYGALAKDQYDREAARSTGHVGRILDPYNWHLLIPNNGVVSNGGGGRGQNHSAVASNGSLIVAYTQGSATVNTSSMSSASLKAQWYSPVTGLAVGSILSVARGAGQYLNCPISGDAVLVITPN